MKLDHHIPHCSTRLPLSCGKSVAEAQLSIIWEDWLLLVMLINNEMGNLTASLRSLTLPHSEMEQFSVSLTYGIVWLHPTTDPVWLRHEPVLYFSTYEHMSCILPCLKLSTSRPMRALPLSYCKSLLKTGSFLWWMPAQVDQAFACHRRDKWHFLQSEMTDKTVNCNSKKVIPSLFLSLFPYCELFML